MVGIKGTGMTSLAVYLSNSGDVVFGWDSEEKFATDEVLISHHIPFFSTLTLSECPYPVDILIYSSAYTLFHPLIQEAIERDIPHFSYQEYLTQLSKEMLTYGVAGTHGKTTCVGYTDTLLSTTGISHASIYGSTLIAPSIESSDQERSLLILESCEYREHFQSYQLGGLLITNIEWEHSDYYPSYQSVLTAFLKRISSLPPFSFVVINNDDEGGRRAIEWTKQHRRDLLLISYGKEPTSDIVFTYPAQNDYHLFSIENLQKDFSISLVGDHFVSDIVGATIFSQLVTNSKKIDMTLLSTLFELSHLFKGCHGRLEKIEHPHITLYNDYAHHPTEIEASLSSLRLLYPKETIVAVFYPHTIGRTETFFDQFEQALSLCDTLLILPVATSARFKTSKELSVELSKRLSEHLGATFVKDEMEAAEVLADILHQNDVCVTMGAGNTKVLIDSLMTIKGYQ
jgi:UDP-N-acetylmuramate--alanine ligase